MPQPALLVLLAIPWVSAPICVLLPERLARAARALALGAALAFAVALAWAAASLPSVAQADWIPSIGVRLSLRLDDLSLALLINLALVALGAVWYAWGYWSHVARPRRAYALLLMFIGSMAGTLLADDAVLFFVFWEATLVSSSLLLAGWGQGTGLGRVTLRYILFTQAGSLLLIAALLWASLQAGSSEMGAVARALAGMSQPAAFWMATLLFLGLAVKLGIVPLHLWLPDAHAAAPMPLTILLAAAMLSMGGYGMARLLAPMLAGPGMAALDTALLVLALASQFYGALMCLSAREIKRVVAYSSVSQMGYVLLGMASLGQTGMQGAVIHVLNHGLIKSALFMAVGMVMQATGRRRVDEIGGLGRTMPAVSTVFFLGTLAMAGLPPFSNFVSEWLILSGGLGSGHLVAGSMALLSPVLTATYGLWLSVRLTFGEPSSAEVGLVPCSMKWSCYAMLALALGLGLLPNGLSELARRASEVALHLGGAR